MRVKGEIILTKVTSPLNILWGDQFSQCDSEGRSAAQKDGVLKHIPMGHMFLSATLSHPFCSSGWLRQVY